MREKTVELHFYPEVIMKIMATVCFIENKKGNR